MSSSRYYRLLADPSATTRWYLRSPITPDGEEVDPRVFTQGNRWHSHTPLHIPLRRKGDSVDFNFCDFDMVVSTSAIAGRLEDAVGSIIQRIPVWIDPKIAGFEIINVCDLVACVDESRSQFTKWSAADERPEKIGDFRMIAKLRIDPVAAVGHAIFRVREWPIALIVSEAVKQLLEDCRTTGITYDRVD